MNGRDEGNGASRELACVQCETVFPWRPPFYNGRWREEWAPKRCSPCDERFRRQEEERLAQEAQEQLAQERHEQAMKEHGEASGLGDRLAQATFEVFSVSDSNRAALEIARRWLQISPVPNLLIVGPTGAGKSYLAACLWNALMQDGRPALWIRVAALMNDIKRGFHDPEIRAQTDRLYRLAQRAEILFLDDAGKAHPGRDTSWIEEQLYGIVDARYCDLLPTALTSEFRGDALQERIGRSVVSRLEHDAVVAGLAKPGVPYRRPRQDER